MTVDMLSTLPYLDASRVPCMDCLHVQGALTPEISERIICVYGIITIPGTCCLKPNTPWGVIRLHPHPKALTYHITISLHVPSHRSHALVTDGLKLSTPLQVKMAFSNQFALSLELTRLLPISWATNKAAEAFMNRARDLHHSGSDIVIEEDLVNVFGRNRISPTLSSSFKNIVAKSNSNVSLWEGITLQGGPGPTTLRALRETPYFAMLVQLSLLVWIFDIRYLATAIADALHERSEGAPLSSKLQSSPSRTGILGVLHVCEKQTSAFNWNMLLHAVSKSLGYEATKLQSTFLNSYCKVCLTCFQWFKHSQTSGLFKFKFRSAKSLELRH